MPSVNLLAAVLSLGLLAGPVTDASCGGEADGTRFVSGVAKRLRCERDAERGLTSPSACREEPDRCGAQVDAVARLVPLGSNEDSTARRRCRNAIRRATQHFVRQRTKELVVLDRRRAAGSQRFVRRVVEGCEAVANVPLPVGEPCASLPDGSGPEAVAFCVRGKLEALIQDASGVSVRPNILFVLTDDQRWDSMSVMPLTRRDLTDRGVDFTESFTVTSLCCPDRATILTGLYAHHHGVKSNRGALDFDHERDTIARQLQENAGYKTALIGKYLVFTGKALGLEVPPGWDQWQVFLQNNDLYLDYSLAVNGKGVPYRTSKDKHYSTDVLARRALRVIGDWANDRWFMYWAPFAPHMVPVPASRHRGALADLPAHRPPSYLSKGEGKPWWVAGERILSLRRKNEPAATDERRIKQLETLLAVDEAVDAFSQLLENLGLTDNTLFVFTSDNGQMWLEHGLILKNYPYEESIRVPLIARYPKLIHVPRRNDDFVQPIDFYPTFAELAGISGEVVNGQSLVPLLESRDVDWRDAIFLEHFEGAGVRPSQAIRTKRYKLIETDAKRGVNLELYDLEEDPFELENLADDPAQAERIEDLKRRLAKLAAE